MVDRQFLVRARPSYDATVPYRRQVIVGLVLVAALTFAGARWSERSERSTRFTLTPEMVEEIQEQASNPAVRAALERMPEVDPAKIKPLGPAVPRPSAARYLDVTLDRAGRPYDVAIERGARIERRPLAVVHAPTSRDGGGRRSTRAGSHLLSTPTATKAWTRSPSRTA
jgi:hypothetical protein